MNARKFQKHFKKAQAIPEKMSLLFQTSSVSQMSVYLVSYALPRRGSFATLGIRSDRFSL